MLSVTLGGLILSSDNPFEFLAKVLSLQLGFVKDFKNGWNIKYLCGLSSSINFYQ